ncbi:MAG TPA: hypothetical protein VIT92_04775, partial [Burkholderiaceae bacterium]
SVLAGCFAWAAYWPFKQARRRAAVLVALAVFSHFVLDFIVHRPEMPVLGAASAQLGLGLYLKNMPLALSLEIVLALTGLAAFLHGCKLPRAKRMGIAALVLLLAAMTLMGLTDAPPPSSPSVMAYSMLITIVVFCYLLRWLGRSPRVRKDAA